MIPAIAGIGAALAVVALVFLVAPVRGRLRLARGRRKEVRKLGHARRPAAGSPGEQEPDLREAAAVRDAERALEQARREAHSIVSAAKEQAAGIVAAAEDASEARIAAARETAGRAAEEISEDAKRSARGIIREAQEKAQAIVDAAELQQAEAERNVARQRELADRTRQDVMTLLRDLLAAARRVPGPDPRITTRSSNQRKRRY